jgi:outer membrane protein assembly factor BamB
MSDFPKLKKYSFYFLYLGIALLLQGMSCQHDDEIPYEFVKPQWDFKLHKNGKQSNSIIDANLLFGDIALIATTDGVDNRFISCVDISNGEELWRWNNIYQPPTEKFDVRYYLKFNNLFFYQVGTRSYCVNLTDGSTYFKNRGSVSFNDRYSIYQTKALLIGNYVGFNFRPFSVWGEYAGNTNRYHYTFFKSSIG